MVEFQATQKAMAEALKTMSERVSDKDASAEKDREREFDKVNALVGVDMKLTIPVLKDSDTDFDRHWRQFQSILDCHNYGRTGVRPLDVLALYRKAFPAGSIRLQIYDNVQVRAQRQGRLPLQAKEVLEEIKTRIKAAIRETPFQREDRLDKEYQALVMGPKSHAEFRAQFEAPLAFLRRYRGNTSNLT